MVPLHAKVQPCTFLGHIQLESGLCPPCMHCQMPTVAASLHRMVLVLTSVKCLRLLSASTHAPLKAGLSRTMTSWRWSAFCAQLQDCPTQSSGSCWAIALIAVCMSWRSSPVASTFQVDWGDSGPHLFGLHMTDCSPYMLYGLCIWANSHRMLAARSGVGHSVLPQCPVHSLGHRCLCQGPVCDIVHRQPDAVCWFSLTLKERGCLCLVRLPAGLTSHLGAGLPFETALRGYLEAFRLPGESQKIYRILQAFSEHYWKQCGRTSPFRCSDHAGLPLFSSANSTCPVSCKGQAVLT